MRIIKTSSGGQQQTTFTMTKSIQFNKFGSNFHSQSSIYKLQLINWKADYSARWSFSVARAFVLEENFSQVSNAIVRIDDTSKKCFEWHTIYLCYLCDLPVDVLGSPGLNDLEIIKGHCKQPLGTSICLGHIVCVCVANYALGTEDVINYAYYDKPLHLSRAFQCRLESQMCL